MKTLKINIQLVATLEDSQHLDADFQGRLLHAIKSSTASLCEEMGRIDLEFQTVRVLSIKEE